MVIRQVKEKQWKHVYNQITTYGGTAPLSLQFDIEINCNGVDYIFKVQPERKRKIIALQAMSVFPDGKEIDTKNYHLIEDNLMLSALLETIIYQGAGKRRP
jgi:hypothetical protein